MKGYADVIFVFTFGVFILALSILTPMVSVYGIEKIDAFDFGVMGASMIGIGASCVVLTGLGCVAATIIGSTITYISIPQFYSILFSVFLFTFAYIISKLARGN